MSDETLTRTGDTPAAPEERPSLVVRAVLVEGAPLRGAQALPVLAFDGKRDVVLGRQAGDTGFSIPLDATLSRRHVRLRLVGLGPEDALLVEDLGSHNGTWVDGARIVRPTAVRAGQVIRVAGTALVVGAEPPERAAALRARTPPGYVALSWASLQVWERVERVAASDAGVLLTGPVGTGKTRLAQHLHDRSGRAGPFVSFNCSAIPVNLEEATLFGVSGGFIPGVREREGWITRARGGTLFLDELADMPPLAQAKLLDAFDPTDPGFIPVGGTARVRPSCRLVSATNKDVFALCAAGALRQDLLSRIVVAQVEVPPLAARREDLVELLDRALLRHGSSVDALAPSAELVESLLLARWTENVRGLESLAARLALGERLSPADARRHADRGQDGPPPELVPHSAGLAAHPVWPPEPVELLVLLRAHDFNVAAAAEALGRRRETLSRLVTATFGQGGATAARRAWRVYEATGQIPSPEA